MIRSHANQYERIFNGLMITLVDRGNFYIYIIWPRNAKENIDIKTLCEHYLVLGRVYWSPST